MGKGKAKLNIPKGSLEMNCPKCGEQLKTLISIEECYHYYEFDGENYDKVDESEGGDITYECPKCGVELAYDEEEAKAILKDEITSEMAKRFAEIAFSGKGG